MKFVVVEDIISQDNKHCVSKWNKCSHGGMVDTTDLKSVAARRPGSNPGASTNNRSRGNDLCALEEKSTPPVNFSVDKY